MRYSQRHGFTLLELMIVVAIISALVALSVPSVARSRTQAREAQVIGFLRQYHIAQIQFQAAGIKDTNSDSIGDFGTLQDLLDANIYARSMDHSDSVASRPALARAGSLLRDFCLPAAYADSKPGKDPKPVKEKEKPPKDKNPESEKPENDNDNDHEGGKPGSGGHGEDDDNDNGPGGGHTGDKPGGGHDGDKPGGGHDGDKPDTGGDNDDNDRPDDPSGDQPADDPGAGGSQGGNDGSSGSGGDQGDNSGPSGGAGATGPAFLQGVSSSLLENGILYGYRFQFTTMVQSDQDPGWYEVTCKPANPRNGGRGFYIDSSGVIRQTSDGTFPNAASKQL